MVERRTKDKDYTDARASTLKCLECGEDNLVDNKVCGCCGANLPMVYSREGRAVRQTGRPVQMKVNPYVRKFTILMIILMVGMATALIIKTLLRG